MKIVITHRSPDFDALSSAYAGLLLHNADHIATISSYENNVDDFLSTTALDLKIKRYNERDIENIKKIDTLIITDCSQRKRVGKLERLIDIAEKVIIYDHHTTQECDIDYDEYILKNYGSSTTILCEILSEKKIHFPKEIATIFALGIYEDTGSLLYKNTNVKDILTVAYLLENGADLSLVSDYVKKDLTREQVFLLNELLNNLTLINFSGLSTALAFASIDEYYDEVAIIASRLMTIEALDSLFILLSAGDRIVLVGRSKSELVDVSKVAMAFGGGGHHGAASAIIKNMILTEAIERLKIALQDYIRPIRLAKDIMTAPVKSLTPDTAIADALDITMRYNLNNMPVLKDNKTIGIISRKDLLYGVKHELQADKISTIMNVEFSTVKPFTPFMLAQELMVSRGYKILPVEDEKGIHGVITRTDLLRILSDELAINNKSNTKDKYSHAKVRNIKNILNDRLPENIMHCVKDISTYATDLGIKLYIVGGFVRDLFIHRNNFDLDFVVEDSDAIEFAIGYAEKINARVSVHDNYKTASIKLPNGDKIDLATARTEYYLTPAALPTVEVASIRNDLFRRDFTINAMAIRIDGERFGELIDYFNGQKDINDRKIRILHSLSFIDDPTRAFRAIRFAVRFNFTIGSHTERLIKHAVGLNLFDRLAGVRLFQELKLILVEDEYLRAIEMMKDYDLLKFFSKHLTLDVNKYKRLEILEDIIVWYEIQFKTSLKLWKARLYVLIVNISQDDTVALLKRFSLSEKQEEDILSDYKLIRYGSKQLKKEMSVKSIYNICSKLSDEAILALSTILADCYENLAKDYLLNYKKISPTLNGDDLIKLGVNKGVIFKKILSHLMNEKLEGRLKDREEEIKFVKDNYADFINN